MPASLPLRPIALAISLALLAAACADEKPQELPRTERVDSPAVPRPDSQTVTLKTEAATLKYDMRSGVVEFVNERLGRRQTYYFDNYGAQEAVYITGGGGDSVGIPFDVSIYTGSWRFDYSTRDREGIAKNQANHPGPVLGLVPDLRGASLTPLGERTIAGQRATGVAFVTNGTGRAWMWRGVPLRVERPLRGGADTLVLEAVAIRPDEKVAPERFIVPDDVAIKRLK